MARPRCSRPACLPKELRGTWHCNCKKFTGDYFAMFWHIITCAAFSESEAAHMVGDLAEALALHGLALEPKMVAVMVAAIEYYAWDEGIPLSWEGVKRVGLPEPWQQLRQGYTWAGKGRDLRLVPPTETAPK